MRWIYFLPLLILLSFSAKGQYGSFGVTDARSLGMGNTYNATSYDLYAIGKNPGLLSKKDGDFKVSIIFPNFTAQQYGVSQAISTFDYYTTNKLRSDGLITLDKEKFELAIQNNGIVFVDMLLGFFSASFHPNERIGSFAFSMSDYMTGYMDIPDIILDVNYGAEIPNGEFSLDNFVFKAWWIRNYAISYSRYIYRESGLYRNNPGFFQSISAGITAKYVMTYAYTDVGLTSQVNYSTGTQTLSGSYQAHATYAFSEDLGIVNSFDDRPKQAPPGFLQLEPAGRGYGIDIGAAAEIRKGWILALSVTDLGSISWKGNSRKSEFEGYIDISGVIDYETIDSLSHNISLSFERETNFRTPMPTAIRLGVALKFEEMFKKFPGKLLVGLDYNQGLNEQPSNYKSPRFSLGFDYRYRPNWPILIGGYTVDFLGIGRGAIGLGYDTYFVDFYVSTIDIFDMVTGGPRFSASLVARWKLFPVNKRNTAPKCF